MEAPDLKTRFLGHCQICEQEQKLHEGRMVHHGYTRPGHGFIEGDCSGVKEVPYEVSCELLKKYLPQVQNHLANLKVFLAGLESGSITHIQFLNSSGFSRRVELVEYVAGVTEYHLFVRQMGYKVSLTKGQISQLEQEIARLERRIADWKPAPIRTIEEQMAEVKAGKDARAAERAAARQVKNAKIAATKAKQAELAARRQAIVDDFKTKFITLAADPTPENKKAAAALANETTKVKYNFFYIRELGCDEALITLGLAKRDDRDARWVTYGYQFNR